MLTAKTSTRSTALISGNFGINLTFLVAPPSQSSDTKWNILYLPGWSAPNSAKTFPVWCDNNDCCHLVVLTVIFSHADADRRSTWRSFCIFKCFYSSFKCSCFSWDAGDSQCLSLLVLWWCFGVSVFLSLKPLTDHLSFLPLTPHISSSVSVPFSILPFFLTALPASRDFSPL